MTGMGCGVVGLALGVGCWVSRVWVGMGWVAETPFGVGHIMFNTADAQWKYLNGAKWASSNRSSSGCRHSHSSEHEGQYFKFRVNEQNG